MKKSTIFLFVLILLAPSVAGCQRSASKAPEVTPEFMEQVGTLLPVDQQIFNATMTAQAIIEEFNMPTQIMQNAQGTPVVITQMPPTAIPTPTPTSAPTPTLQALTRPQNWAVQGGETIYCLSRRFDVDPGDMLAINNLYAGSMLNIGDVLIIPQTGSWPGGDRQILDHPDTWNVTPGETVYEIACAYGDVWPEHIIQANGLSEPYDLTGIETLQIP